MIAWLVDPLHYEFMVRALVVAVVVAAVSAVLSCWLVLIGWSLMGNAIAYAVLPGVVLAFVLGVPFVAGALVFGLLAVALIGAVRGTGRIKEDTAIGVVFTGLFSLGLVLVSVVPSDTHLDRIVFGNLLGLAMSDVVQVVVIGVIVLDILLLKRRDFTLYAFDPIHAQAIGLHPRLLGWALLAMLALTSVVTLQAVGVILVAAMLIIPGATAQLLTERFDRMLVIAPAISVSCSLLGVYLSYHLDAATGGTIVLTLAVAFALAYLFAPRRGVVVRTARRRCRRESGGGSVPFSNDLWANPNWPSG